MRLARSPSGKTLGATLAAALLCASAAATAQTSSQQAQKCVNAKGETYYTNKPAPGDKCSAVTGAISVVPGRPSGSAGPTSAPGSGQRDAQQENARREVEAAESQVAEARRALAEQEAIRTGDERNYQRVLDRLKPYQDRLAEAEKNLERVRSQASGPR